MTDVSDFLEHYGVKGMKWGVRKRRNESARAQQFGPSKDAKRAGRALKKSKTSGLSSLTNQELKDLNNRLQLEKTYSQLVPAKKTVLKQGKDFVNELLGYGDTVNRAINFANSPAGGLIRENLNKRGSTAES